MSCMLWIIGKDLDVDAFITKSKLRPFNKFYKGEPRFTTQPGGVKKTSSGLALVASIAGFNNFKKQLKDTAIFLEKNRKKLSYIIRTKEIQYAILDFGIDLRIDGKEVFYQSEILPSKLLCLAGELGIDIELSIYPVNMEELLKKKYGPIRKK